SVGSNPTLHRTEIQTGIPRPGSTFAFPFGGEGGIRTHGTLARTPDFESGPFDHSGTSTACHPSPPLSLSILVPPEPVSQLQRKTRRSSGGPSGKGRNSTQGRSVKIVMVSTQRLRRKVEAHFASRDRHHAGPAAGHLRQQA